MTPEAELAELLATLERTQNRIRELTGDEVDAVMLPSGAAHLLSRAQQELRQQTELLSAVMDALPTHIALLDSEGTILSVNRAWSRYAESHGGDGDQVGVNYLQVCRRDSEAEPVLEGLEAILGGTTEAFELVYPCHSPTEQRWFRFLGAPTEAGAVVMHVDVTEGWMATEELRASRALLAMASNLSRVGAWTADLQTGKVQLSEEYRRIFTPSSSPTVSFDEAYASVLEEDRASLQEKFEACAREGVPYEWEFRFRSEQGDVVWARLFGESVYDDQGKVVGIRGATQDVTTYHRALQELRAGEERFRVLAQATDDVIWDWDLVSDEVWWSSRMEVAFGHRPESLEPGSESWTSRVHPQDLPGVFATLESFLEDAESEHCSVEYRFRRGDGSYATVAHRGTLLRNEQGLPVRMIGSLADITARRLAEQRVAAQASLIDQATDAIIVHTLEGKILFWSRGSQLLYGWDTAEAEGCTLSELLETNKTTSGERVTRFLRRGEWSGELEQRNREGESLTVFARWTLLRDAFGEPEAVLAIHTDVTERKGLQELFHRSQRLESIGTLAGGIAHDLNNVLAPILMAAELLDEEVTSEGGRGLLETLRSSSRRGADLVRQILTFARGSGGTRHAIDALELVSELEKLMRETFPRNLVIKVVAEGERLWVQGDPTQLHQVLLNLCVNARDATPEGGRLTLTLRRVMVDEARASLNPLSEAGPHVRISVQDTGCGIPLEVQDKVMEPFFTTKETGQGTGLGLSTAFTIVRDHGGLLTFTSEEGQGTTFQIDLPVAIPATDSAERRPEPLVRGEGEVVLLVDDEVAIRRLAEKFLERNGYKVLLAADGVEAIALYRSSREKIAAVVTDMSMPTMDGPTLVRALRSLDPHLLIIGCSGRSDSTVTSDLNLDEFLEKPYEFHTLFKTLRKVLDESKNRGASTLRGVKTVLVVDDDRGLLRLVSRVLRAEGHKVLTAPDASQALELLGKEPVNCLLTDINLPGISGRELKVRVEQNYPETPVVLMSGSVGEPGMLAKPFTIEELKSLVRQTLGDRLTSLPNGR